MEGEFNEQMNMPGFHYKGPTRDVKTELSRNIPSGQTLSHRPLTKVVGTVEDRSFADDEIAADIMEEKGYNLAVATPNHTDVLLFAYMRGGSTFTGEILGHSRDTFYIYEPLRGDLQGYRYSIHDYYGLDKICSQNEDTCR